MVHLQSMTAKRQELNWLKNELAHNEQFWEVLHKHKQKEYGGAKDVYIFEHHVLKVKSASESNDESQLLHEIWIWKKVPKYIKRHLCKIEAYGIIDQQNYTDLRKTTKYNLFDENFIIMEKLNTNQIDIKNFLFPNVVKLYLSQRL